MNTATLCGIRGIGELRLHEDSNEAVLVGCWYLLDPSGLPVLLKAHKKDEAVAFIGPVVGTGVHQKQVQAVRVRIEDLKVDVDGFSDDISLAVSLYAET